MKCGHTADEHAEIIRRSVRRNMPRDARAVLEIEAETVVLLALDDLEDATLTT